MYLALYENRRIRTAWAGKTSRTPRRRAGLAHLARPAARIEVRGQGCAVRAPRPATALRADSTVSQSCYILPMDTRVCFFQELDGRSPVIEWLKDLRGRDRRGYAKCIAVIHRLGTLGHELRRPTSDFLRGGIYKLRACAGHVNYRILYFFHGRGAVVLAHALTKEDSIPLADMERALRRKRAFESAPETHTFKE